MHMYIKKNKFLLEKFYFLILELRGTGDIITPDWY